MLAFFCSLFELCPPWESKSVGKSFALNHFVDTSFAGSAMRTTEGIWMSVTPTKEAIKPETFSGMQQMGVTLPSLS
jgi:hypothetical protein